ENIQRRDLEPEEEYDGLMTLRKLNPKSYGTHEQLAKAIGKSRRYVEDHINAVETVRGLRRETKAEVTVKSAPTPEERKEGVLPLKHATYIHKAEETPSIQGLPSRERAVKLKELAETIAPLPQPEAEKVVSHFVMAPQKSMEEIRKDVHLHLPPLLIPSFFTRSMASLAFFGSLPKKSFPKTSTDQASIGKPALGFIISAE